mmetsp:Transcript_5011/g.10771  ORF Transcript_5011/g.10771 Transcript_5011/m.10771 type:complete len:216 (-) Transcript_5011:671-1318(-)
MPHDGAFDAVAEGGARHAPHYCHVLGGEDQVVDGGDAARDLPAEHDGEPPLAALIHEGMPLCEAQARRQLAHHRSPTCAWTHHDAPHRGGAPAGSPHRGAWLHGGDGHVALRPIWPNAAQQGVGRKAAPTSHELLRHGVVVCPRAGDSPRAAALLAGGGLLPRESLEARGLRRRQHGETLLRLTGQLVEEGWAAGGIAAKCLEGGIAEVGSSLRS